MIGRVKNGDVHKFINICVGNNSPIRPFHYELINLWTSPSLLEKKSDSQFKVVFEANRHLMAPKEMPTKKIGFQLKEKRASCSARG